MTYPANMIEVLLPIYFAPLFIHLASNMAFIALLVSHPKGLRSHSRI